MLIFRNSLRLTVPSRYYFATKAKKQKNYYQILEVPSNATPTTIKKNYIKLAKLYHPDVYKGADKNRFQKIQQAYDILSSQKQRSKYDETIKIRSSWNQTKYEEDVAQPADKDGTNQYGKKPNQFRYAKPKVQINIDQEYEKFFSKKSKTQFQEIRLHEQPEFKAMSEIQRIRRRFTQVYPDLNYGHKLNYSKSYSEILHDQISQKNRHQKQQKDKKDKFQAKYNEQSIARKIKYIKITGGLIFLTMLPFIFSFKTKLQLEKKARKQLDERSQQLMRDVNDAEVRARLRFK